MAKAPQPAPEPAWDPKAPDPVVWRHPSRGDGAPVNEEVSTFHQRIRDAGQLTWMKQAGEAIQTEVDTGWKQAQRGYLGYENVPQGYEQYADAFGSATSPEETESIRQHVQRNVEARQRRMKETFGTTLMDDLVVNVFDPTNLVPIAGAAGQGAVKGALKGAASLGALSTATGAVNYKLDPTSSGEEVAIGAAFGTVLGAGFGGIGGAVGRAAGAASPSVRTRLKLPGGPGRITSGFGERAAPKAGASTKHGGIDIGYPEGTPLRAQADGKVVSVRKTAKGGNEVHIDYGDGVVVKMLHLRDAAVREGDTIREGSIFGHSGRTGNVTGPHLHMAVTVNGKAVDPLGEVTLGFRPADHGAAVDAIEGVAVPETANVFGTHIPVVMERGSGEEVRFHKTNLDEAVDRTLDEIGQDTARERISDPSLAAIDAYLKDGGAITKVKKGRRAIDPRKWEDAPDLEVTGVGRDPAMVRQKDIAMVANRLSGRIAEIMNAPRLNLDEVADENWLRRLAPDLAAVPKEQRNASWAKTAPKLRDVVHALSQRLEELRYHQLDETNASPLVQEAEAHASARYTQQLDEADIEIAAQRRAEQRVLRDDGTIHEIRADRPLSAAERRRGRVLPPTAAEQEATDADFVHARLSYDPDQIQANYLAQKWVGEPLPGGRQMDVEALGSHADYFNFVVNRAVKLEELDRAGGVGEGSDELLARINEEALQEVHEGKGLFVPDGNALKRSVLAYTPMEQMHRLVPDDAEIQRSLYKLAGDGGVMLHANRLGLPAVEGGSVFQRKDMWVGKLYDVTDAVKRAWLKSIGRDSTRGRGGTVISAGINRMTHLGESGLNRFWNEVGRAIVGFEDVRPEAAEAAQAWFKVMEKVELEARNLGLFTTTKDAGKVAQQAELRVANLRKKLDELEQRFGQQPDYDVKIEGADRRERSQNATAYLEANAKKGQLNAVRPFPAEEADYYRFRYTSKDGKTTVDGKYTFDGEHIDNVDIGDTNNPVDLGNADLRNLLKQLQDRHPEAKKLSGYRMTGARKAEGSGPEFMTMDLPGRKDPLADMRRLLADQEADAAKLRELADSPITHKGEEGHFSRIWNKAALAKNEEGAKQMLERAYAREQHPAPRAAAEEAYELLMANNEGEMVAPGTPGFLKVRSIPATNREAWDFIVQDPQVVGAIYLRRMGSAIEMTRMFGDSFGLGEIDRIAVDLVERGVEPEKVSKAIQLWEDQRDRIVGGFHGKDPLSWDNRSARAIRNFTQLELMGGSPKSQLSDLARIVLTQGVGLRHQLLGKADADAGLLGAVMAHVKGDLDKFHPGGPAKEAGEALDLVIAQAAAKLVEADDALVVTRQTGLERLLAAAVPKFHILSLLTPMTVIMKEWAGVAAASNLIRDAKKVAAGEASDRLVAQLAQKGISPEMAATIAGMPTEMGKSGLHLANVESWLVHEEGAKAAAAFRAAVNSEIRRSVITPGPLDKPAIADGVSHDMKARSEAEKAIELKTIEVLELRGELGSVYDLPDGHPAKQDVIERLTEAAGELTQMKRNRGRAGRKEAPFMTLPFQLRSYGLAAGPKGLHGLLTGSDRRTATGILSLLAAGYLSWRWKIGGAADEQPLEAHVAGMIDNSGILAWAGDLAKSIDTLLSSVTGGVLPGTMDPKEGGWDEAGALAPSASAFERLYRPFVEKGDDFGHAVRKLVPLNNGIYLKWLFDALEDGFDGDVAGVGGGRHDDAPFTHFAGGLEPKKQGNGLDRGVLPNAPAAPGVDPGVLLKGPKIVADLNAVLDKQRAEGRPRNFTEDPAILDDLDFLLSIYGHDASERVKKRAAARAKKAAKKAHPRRSQRSFIADVTYR